MILDQGMVSRGAESISNKRPKKANWTSSKPRTVCFTEQHREMKTTHRMKKTSANYVSNSRGHVDKKDLYLTRDLYTEY